MQDRWLISQDKRPIGNARTKVYDFGGAMTDPRVERTLQALFVALDELLAEKAFSEISVSDLARRANVGRQTFYRHFDSIGAMLEVRLRMDMAEQIELARAESDPDAGLFIVTRLAFEKVADQPHIARAILSGEAGADALSSVRDQIVALWDGVTDDPRGDFPEGLHRYVATYHAGAICAILLEWIDAGCSPDPDTMARFVVELNTAPRLVPRTSA